jgi:hypothetical protein
MNRTERALVAVGLLGFGLAALGHYAIGQRWLTAEAAALNPGAVAVENGRLGGNSWQEDSTMHTTTYGPFSFDGISVKGPKDHRNARRVELLDAILGGRIPAMIRPWRLPR